MVPSFQSDIQKLRQLAQRFLHILVTALVVVNSIPLVYTLLHMQVMAPTLLRNLLLLKIIKEHLV